MCDRYDFASAIKDVKREMPEAWRLILNYIKILENKINILENDSDDNDADKEND